MLTDAEIMAQVYAAFQEEQAEHRQAISELLLELERQADLSTRTTQLDHLFRAAHSLKGGARAAGQYAVEQLAHRIEDLFSAVRQGRLSLTPAVCDPIYAALDVIGLLMSQNAGDQADALAAYAPLLQTLAHSASTAEGVATGAAPSAGAMRPVASGAHPDSAIPLARAEADPAVSGAHPDSTASAAQVAAHDHRAGRGEAAGATTSSIRVATASLDGALNETGELIACSLGYRQRAHELQLLTARAERWRVNWRQVRPIYAHLRQRQPSLRPAVHYLAERAEQSILTSEHGATEETTVLLDALESANALISELAEQLRQVGQQASEGSARLETTVERLHTQLRRVRMLPLATILGQFRLQARDIARTAGKQIVLNIDDGGVEAERQVLEQLREVLLHLLRNAIDHGIEPPELRAARGKAPAGRLTLCATASGDRLTLTLTDDGAGLDLEAIRQRALAGGMSPSELAHKDDAEVMQLIFAPGFSTRERVGALSGRGVGLDIVRALVERMHGRVAVQSSPGEGCAFLVTVPLSLSSTRGLLVRLGQERYAVPLEAILRIVAVARPDMQLLEGQPVLLINRQPVRVVQLGRLLGVAWSTEDDPAPTSQLALLLGSGERQAAFLVDAVLGEQELIIHRLPAPLGPVRCIAGATILADGEVLPILDVVDVIDSAMKAQYASGPSSEPEQAGRSPTVLVVDDSITTRTLEKNILEAAGYQVRLATDGVEALTVLQALADSGGCQLLLSDVDMPRLNGFELTRQVRATAAFQHLPIVLVTSLDTPGDRAQGIAAGADAYIVKRTFDQGVLLDTIAQLL